MGIVKMAKNKYVLMNHFTHKELMSNDGKILTIDTDREIEINQKIIVDDRLYVVIEIIPTFQFDNESGFHELLNGFIVNVVEQPEFENKPIINVSQKYIQES